MQVYAASIMFGYFVRRVDKRFQLERSLGLLPQNQEEAVARLERLFSQVQHPLHQRLCTHSFTAGFLSRERQCTCALHHCQDSSANLLAGGGFGWSR